MENFFNDAKIGKFLEDYPCMHWVSILKSLAHYSIDSIKANYHNNYLTLEELFKILGEEPQKNSIIKKIKDLYVHLHRVGKSMKHMLKANDEQYKHRAKSKRVDTNFNGILT